MCFKSQSIHFQTSILGRLLIRFDSGWEISQFKNKDFYFGAYEIHSVVKAQARAVT